MRTKQKSFEELDYMFLREEDWDDEGALPLSKTTYDKAYNWIQNNISNNEVSPRVSLCRDGSIDFDWYKDDYRLLLNILSKEDLEIHYYGCRWNGNTVTEEVENILKGKEIDSKLKKYLHKNFKL